MTKHIRRLATIALTLISGGLFAADLYVAPNGTPAGNGTKQRPLDVFTALSAKSPAKPGDTIYLMAGQYDGKMDGIKRLPFEVAVSGAKDNPVKVMPAPGGAAHLNGSVSLKSSYAHFIGLEIGDLKWDPRRKEHIVSTALNASDGAGAKVINCNIFGGAMGIGCWSSAKELEVSGCLIHDFGYLEKAGRGHGHAFYAQNETGTKLFMHNIAYRGCGWNVYVYTQQGQIKGFDIIENICYIAGAYKPGQTMDNFLIAGYPGSDRIRLIGNVGYQPSDVQKWRPNARLSSVKKSVNIKGECADNYLMGASFGLSLGSWQDMTVRNNTIWGTRVVAEISSGSTGTGVRGDAKPNLKGYNVDGNTYIANGEPKPFRYATHERITGKDLLTFAGWQALGLDKNGKLLPGRNGKPTGTRVFVFPNKYQEGRANVGVFNWDGLERVEVDLSKVLTNGMTYRIYNCLDIKQLISMAKPVVEAKYDGQKVELPMRKSSTSPDFDAFLVLPAQ